MWINIHRIFNFENKWYSFEKFQEDITDYILLAFYTKKYTKLVHMKKKLKLDTL